MMKYLLAVIVLMNVVGLSFGLDKNKIDGKDLKASICYASDEVHKSFIGPPVRLKSGQVKPATILVEYIDFPDEPRLAFQYAVDIWQNLISSPVPIHVKASWVGLSRGVLGSSRPADFYKNFNSTQIWDSHYPVALAEKMLGAEINQPGDFEIIAQFNKDFVNWYFGTDGNTPTDQYDFVSVVLHELAHGLGFTGNFYSLRGSGGYSSQVDNLPAAFDEFIVNENGDKLVNTDLFPNPSKALNQNLISDALEFNTKLANGYLPKLYAPVTWNAGSSIYHLDESTYGEGDANSLMTPYSGLGEAIHDPGPYTLDILYETGWKCISIKHKQIKDKEYVDGPISFDAQIKSDYDLNLNKVFLVYSTNKFVKRDSVLLQSTAVADLFNAKLSFTQNGTYQYFFSATDTKNRRYVYPSSSPGRALSFKIGVDNEPPVISVQPIKFVLETDPSVKIVADVTDNLGIKSVKLQYFVNVDLVKEIDLKNDSNDVFSGQLTFPIGTVKEGDIVSYRIVAVDASSNGNIGRVPESGYNTFRIEGIKSPVDKYINNFDTPTNDFISVDFTIETASGFDNPALNSPHPYISPNSDNTNLNFITMLKYPIVLKTGGKMSFDEIVLVEPGETGTKYGDTNFFDYVIVEGSKNGGTIWKPLVDGYDCSSQKSWLTLYNSSITGQDSKALATKDLFVKREFGLLDNGNFSAGDTILVRFRLFSDPYANGWGWIIDNLSIQDFGTSIQPVLLSSGEVEFYPNPANDLVNFRIQAQKEIHKLVLKAYNSGGNLIFNRSFSVEANQFETTIDVKNLIPGLYLFAVEPENGRIVTRKILIQ